MPILTTRWDCYGHLNIATKIFASQIGIRLLASNNKSN